MRLRELGNGAGERLPREGIEFQLNPFTGPDKLHFRLVDDHHRLEAMRVAHHAEHRSLLERGPDVLSAERVARPGGQLAPLLTLRLEAGRRQHDAGPRGHEHQFLAVIPLAVELLANARQRLLDRADLEAGGRIGKPLPLETLEPALVLRRLPLQVGDLEVEIDI